MWLRRRVAARYISGNGIEIGALHVPMPLPSGASVKYLDRLSTAELRAEYPELRDLPLAEVDIVEDGEDPVSIPAESQDFLIASHVIEHCEDPVGTLKNWLRILRPGGVIYLVVPNRKRTFDRGRRPTSTEHLLRDHREGPEVSRSSHYLEWVGAYANPGAEANRQAAELEAEGYRIHFHVWTAREFCDSMTTIAAEEGMPMVVKATARNFREFIVVLEKNERRAPRAGVSPRRRRRLVTVAPVSDDSGSKARSNLGAKAVFVAKAIGRRLRWAPHDIRFALTSGKQGLQPPRGISFVGHGDFREVGQWYVQQFQALGGLQPEHRVLDMGCGVGRMAIPLTEYLKEGGYEGFDTSAEMIRWCRKNITAAYPRFRFTHAPIYNRKYNPFGTISAQEFRFPYADAEFDFAFATSLFTHLGIEETRHYLAELARVLKPGGSALVTFFLLGGEGRPADGRGLAFDFAHEFGPLRTTDPKEPEAAVAYPEALLRSEAGAVGLSVEDPIVYGRWPELNVGRDIQDMVILRRVAV